MVIVIIVVTVLTTRKRNVETGTTMTLRRGYSRTFIYLALCCCWGSLAVLAFSPTFHNGHSRPVLLKKGSAGDPRVVSTPTSSSPLSSTRSSDAIGGSSGGGGGGGRQQRPVRLNLSEEARDEQVGQLFAWVTRAFAGDERYNDLVLALIAIFADDETRPPPGSKSDLLLGEAVAAQRKEALQQWRRKQQRTQKEQLEGGGVVAVAGAGVGIILRRRRNWRSAWSRPSSVPPLGDRSARATPWERWARASGREGGPRAHTPSSPSGNSKRVFRATASRKGKQRRN